jgi:hypothetical protein
MPSAIIDHGNAYEIIYDLKEWEDKKIIDKPYQLKVLFPGEIANIQKSTPEQVQRILSRLYTNE